jgi:hypothetical protein
MACLRANVVQPLSAAPRTIHDSAFGARNVGRVSDPDGLKQPQFATATWSLLGQTRASENRMRVFYLGSSRHNDYSDGRLR